MLQKCKVLCFVKVSWPETHAGLWCQNRVNNWQIPIQRNTKWFCQAFVEELVTTGHLDWRRKIIPSLRKQDTKVAGSCLTSLFNLREAHLRHSWDDLPCHCKCFILNRGLELMCYRPLWAQKCSKRKFRFGFWFMKVMKQMSSSNLNAL